jgi:hypothetical protein
MELAVELMMSVAKRRRKVFSIGRGTFAFHSSMMSEGILGHLQPLDKRAIVILAFYFNLLPAIALRVESPYHGSYIPRCPVDIRSCD